MDITVIIISLAFGILLFLLCVWLMRWMLHLDGIYKELKIQTKLLSHIAFKQGVSKEEVESIVKNTKI